MRVLLHRLCLGAAIAGLVLSGCNLGTHNLSSEAPYSLLIGHSYRTQVASYLFKLSSSERLYIGLNNPDALRGAKTLPVAVSRENIGKTFLGATIQDIVPVGAKLVAKSVIRNVSGQGDIVFYLCSLEYDGKKVELVDTYFIQKNIDGSFGQLPDLDPAIAARIP